MNKSILQRLELSFFKGATARQALLAARCTGVRCAAPASVIAEKELAWLGEARSKPGVCGASWVSLATLRPGPVLMEVVRSGFRYRKGRTTY